MRACVTHVMVTIGFDRCVACGAMRGPASRSRFVSLELPANFSKLRTGCIRLSRYTVFFSRSGWPWSINAVLPASVKVHRQAAGSRIVLCRSPCSTSSPCCPDTKRRLSQAATQSTRDSLDRRREKGWELSFLRPSRCFSSSFVDYLSSLSNDIFELETDRYFYKSVSARERSQLTVGYF